MSSLSIAVVGATGLVGTTLLSLLEERNFPIKEIFLVASQQSAGREMTFHNQPHPIHDLATFDFHKTQLAFFCVSNDLTEKFAPIANHHNHG